MKYLDRMKKKPGWTLNKVTNQKHMPLKMLKKMDIEMDMTNSSGKTGSC